MRVPLVPGLTGLSLLVALNLGASCSRTQPPPVVELTAAGQVDATVAALVAQYVAQARQAPADAERRATLAMVYEGNELWDEADRAWADALALDPGQPVWRLHRAIAARQAGHDDLARELLLEVVARDPELAGGRYRLGEVLLESGDVEGARREFEAARRLAPASHEPLIGLAELAASEDQHALAVELCRSALALAPDSRRAQYVMGLSLRGLGRLDEARDALQAGLGASRGAVGDPLSERVASFRQGFTVRIAEANELERAGRPQEARRILERVVREHPDDVTALNNLAAVQVQLGAAEEALAVLEHARALEPTQFATYLNRAAAELALGRIEDAYSSASRAIQLSRSVGQPYFVRARTLIAMGRPHEAYDDLLRATELESTNWMPFALLGDVALTLGRTAEAVRYLEATLQRKADYLPAHTRLVLAYERLGQRDNALRALEGARRVAPGHPDIATLSQRLGR